MGNSAKRAAKKGIEHTITDAWVRARLSQPCAITGLPFVFLRPGQQGVVHPHSPSLDRINPLKGYTPSNTRAVVYIFNTAKGAHTDAEVFEFCLTIAYVLRKSRALSAAPETTSAATRTDTVTASDAATTRKGTALKQNTLPAGRG